MKNLKKETPLCAKGTSNGAEQISVLLNGHSRADHRLDICDLDSLRRKELETFIGKQFANAHQTTLNDFLPHLIGLGFPSDFHAAIGFSFASKNKLFLENYLESSVESLLSARLEKSVDRKYCVEVGNLAASRSGSILALFIILVGAMSNNGFKYFIFTAISPLREKFRRMGLKLEELGAADRYLITNSSTSDWGSYYQNDPTVICCELKQALSLIEQNDVFNWYLKEYASAIDSLTSSIGRQEII